MMQLNMNHLHGTVINGFNSNSIIVDAIYNTIAMFNKIIMIYGANYK